MKAQWLIHSPVPRCHRCHFLDELYVYTNFQGLYFNEFSNGCDFLRNVNCAGKDTTETEKTEDGKEESEEDDDDSEEEDPKSLKNILKLVNEAGGDMEDGVGIVQHCTGQSSVTTHTTLHCFTYRRSRGT